MCAFATSEMQFYRILFCSRFHCSLSSEDDLCSRKGCHTGDAQVWSSKSERISRSADILFLNYTLLLLRLFLKLHISRLWGPAKLLSIHCFSPSQKLLRFIVGSCSKISSINYWCPLERGKKGWGMNGANPRLKLRICLPGSHSGNIC